MKKSSFCTPKRALFHSFLPEVENFLVELIEVLYKKQYFVFVLNTCSFLSPWFYRHFLTLCRVEAVLFKSIIICNFAG